MRLADGRRSNTQETGLAVELNRQHFVALRLVGASARSVPRRRGSRGSSFQRQKWPACCARHGNERQVRLRGSEHPPVAIHDKGHAIAADGKPGRAAARRVCSSISTAATPIGRSRSSLIDRASVITGFDVISKYTGDQTDSLRPNADWYQGRLRGSNASLRKRTGARCRRAHRTFSCAAPGNRR